MKLSFQWKPARFLAVSLFCLSLLCIVACEKVQDSIHDNIEHGLLPGKLTPGENITYHVEDRMKYYDVPAVSIAVIDNMKIRWAGTYGVRSLTDTTQIDSETLFQAASVSKPIAAVGALHLVKNGHLSLDKDINTFLSSWNLPRENYQGPITLRQLLSHSAGTGVGGFVGYDQDTSLPTLIQMLEGESPANSPAVRLVDTPGTHFRYSGGGYLIVQQMMEDVMDMPFQQIMHDQVFSQLEMDRSYYAPLNKTQKSNAAQGHLSGQVFPNYGPIHTESAAGGLWTTPTDLSKLLIELMEAYQGESEVILSSRLMNELMKKRFWNFGLGFRIMGEGENIRFSHGGATIGWHSHVMAFPEKGEGVVVMTNGEHGWLLWTEIERAVSAALDWPIIKPKIIDKLKMDDSTFNRYTGMYNLNGAKLNMQHSEDILKLNLGNLTLNLIPTAKDTFEIREIEGQAIFEFDTLGKVKEFDLWVGEPDWSPYRRWTLRKIEEN
jgi:CubicO group peptidase (beta-lactamase class C family)